MDWKTMLAHVTGSVDEHLLLRIEYLVAENRILREQITGRVQLSDAERQALAELGAKLGKQALEYVATIVQPDTILGWNRTLAAEKFDGSTQRKSLGRPLVNKECEDWGVRMAKENRGWGYDRIAGALAELGYDISDQTVGNILKRRGIPTAPERKKTTTWKDCIRSHLDVLWATDFFSTEVWTRAGLVTFYVLFFIKLDTRAAHIAGITAHPWLKTGLTKYAQRSQEKRFERLLQENRRLKAQLRELHDGQPIRLSPDEKRELAAKRQELDPQVLQALDVIDPKEPE